MRNMLLLGVLLILVLILISGCTKQKTEIRPLVQLNDPSIGLVGSIHEHAVILIFLDGNLLDLSKPEYMLRSEPVHVENLDGAIIHKHATGITVGHFLQTLGISFDKNCLVTDKQDSYCNKNGNTLKFYVNGDINNDFNNYVFREEDRLLISYGNEDEDTIKGQIAFLDNIEIYS